MERPRFKMAGYTYELKDDDVIHAAWAMMIILIIKDIAKAT
jgi:hypothetical protein